MTSTLDFTGGSAPKSIRIIVWVTSILSLLAALISPLYHQYVGYPGPQEFLSLSWYGLENFWLWQLVTFLFIEPSFGGLTFFYLINLAFMMYLLWLMGSEISNLLGEKAFMTLYFLSGFGAGLLALLFASTFTFIAGPTPAVLAVLVVWTMLYPERQLLLFFVIPVTAKWLTTVIVAALFLVLLSQGQFTSLIYYFSGIILGYLYASMYWSLKMPFQALRGIDSFSAKLQGLFGKKPVDTAQNKIVEFPSGKQVLDDDQFVDQMLAKISRYGEKSLSWQERDRLKKISERKSKR